MKKLFLFFFISLSAPAFSQIDSINNDLFLLPIDSVHLSIWYVHTKEMSIPGQEKEYEKEIERIVLSDNDQEILMLHLRNPKSYDGTRALLHHYNLVFDLYHSGTISTQIKISTMTGNVNIENKLENLYFRNNCSEQLGEVLKSLLRANYLLKFFDELDLEGISTSDNPK